MLGNNQKKIRFLNPHQTQLESTHHRWPILRSMIRTITQQEPKVDSYEQDRTKQAADNLHLSQHDASIFYPQTFQFYHSTPNPSQPKSLDNSNVPVTASHYSESNSCCPFSVSRNPNHIDTVHSRSQSQRPPPFSRDRPCPICP